METTSLSPEKAGKSKAQEKKFEIMDGNEAAAYVAYRTNEICAIYPITPSSAMGEFSDEWSSDGKKNIYGTVPTVIEMQSEAGAAGALHGSLQGGALSTTFTCSQGLLLMIPNMYKIAGELTPTVFQIAARALATHALSIFGDHSDVMAVRSTGFSMLFGNNPQEAMDMALIAQSSTLRSRVPFLNIFDGFRTSHELNKVELIEDDVMRSMINPEDVKAHRNRALNPESPFIRGTAQNPDVFFQGREASNTFYQNVPSIVQQAMDRFAELTGRSYKLFEYYGDQSAEDIIIIMGSGNGAVRETVDYLNAQGKKTGVLSIRLFRPFSVKDFIHAIPTSVKRIAVLDRCKENGGIGEPLYMDVCGALREGWKGAQPSVIGGRYGLASKEFNPGMVKAVFDEMIKAEPKNHFTIGIHDDITHTSLEWDENFNLESQHRFRGLFYGLGADGTVSANKNSIKIIGDGTNQYVQGYFVYDSKKSGSLTVSHLRFGDNPIRSTYLVQSANFIACHHFSYLTKYDVLKYAEKGATFLLNVPYDANDVWDRLPDNIQEEIIHKQLKFYVVNASSVARETGMGSRINTILQTCFFAISNVLPREEAIQKIKEAIYKSYSKKGEAAVQKNYVAVDQAVAHLHEINYSGFAIGRLKPEPLISGDASEFVKDVIGQILAGEGDSLPVSAFPFDGTYPSGTTQYEKRNIADKVPVWDADLCSQCGKCFIICPHAAIRCKVYDKSALSNAPSTFKSTAPIGKEFNRDTEVYSLQVAVEDCTGCNLCTEVCPIESKTEKGHKAINMVDQLPIKEQEKVNWDYFLSLPDLDRDRVNRTTVKGTQFYEPLFEFSGACSGCGETPYLKLLTQLFGDRMIVANATGCSSIFGGNLPTTPWTHNKEGHGPAWANSLFEDNAEFGLGLRLATDKKKETALHLLHKLKNIVGPDLAEEIAISPEITEGDFSNRRKHITKLREVLRTIDRPDAKELLQLTDFLSEKSLWIIGGDGWAYDIGFSGLDHVLSTGENVNILVLDTEVYSNTGGQKSKSTPMGSSAKFAVKGKQTSKKDLALQAIAHGNAYVAQIAIGANDQHTVRTLLEAEAYNGPSIVIAYSHCIAHGYDMAKGAEHQVNAVKSGYWPLFRYNPRKGKGERFTLDSKEPTLAVGEFMYKENRFDVIRTSNPARAEDFLHREESEVANHWEKLLTLKGL